MVDPGWFTLNAPWTIYAGEAIFWTVLVHLIQLIFKERNAWSVYIEEFFCVIQVVVLSYEARVMRTAYGDLAFAAATFLNIIIFMKVFRTDRRYPLRTNLLSSVHYCAMTRTLPDIHFFLHTAMQLFSAWVGYQYLRLNLMRRDDAHIRQLAETAACTTQIQTNTFAAAAIEFALALVFRTVAHKEKHYRGGTILAALTAAACAVTGYPFTGGYFNPTVAFALQFNCMGAAHWEFFLVYFVGPILGTLVAGRFGDNLWGLMPRSLEESLRADRDDLQDTPLARTSTTDRAAEVAQAAQAAHETLHKAQPAPPQSAPRPTPPLPQSAPRPAPQPQQPQQQPHQFSPR